MMRFLSLAGLAACVIAAAPARAAGPNAFDFVALGDMPYAIPGDYARFERLIGAINASNPAFSIHVGDIKSGSTPCTDEAFQKVQDEFRTFEQPLVYTIGDNEWTDCHREKAGKFDPLERLAKVREMFFSDPSVSQGKAPMGVESQAKAMPEKFGRFVENARWSKNGVLFATVHVVGSNNNFEVSNLKTVAEFFERDQANVAWIEDTFAKAKETGAKAVVLAWQADTQDIAQTENDLPRASGFVNTIKAVERGAKAFGRPVLVISGDVHTLDISPFRDTSRKPVKNVMRLQVMGEKEVQAVRVTVDPDSPGIFGFTPLIVPENLGE